MIESNGNASSNQLKTRKLPILIVCYLRPANLEKLLQNQDISGRKIYIFIDKCTTNQFSINEDVYRIAKKYSLERDIQILRSNVNVGVGQGVPSAIEWISATEPEFVILEDDCIPMKGALDWFDQKITRIDERILIISGFSPVKNTNSAEPVHEIESKYPLIWGWATTRRAWGQLKPRTYSNGELFRQFLHSKWTLNSKSAFAFFIAAQIRVQKGVLKAWDAPVAVNMLFGNYRCLTPSQSLIQNVGDDLYASHPPSSLPDVNSVLEHLAISDSTELDKVIESVVYKMKIRHLFAPLRASLFT